MKKRKNQADSKHLSTAAPSMWKEYAGANLLFFLFLSVLAAIVYFLTGAKWDESTKQVFRFLFLVVGGTFVVASLLDWLYERYAAPEDLQEEKEAG